VFSGQESNQRPAIDYSFLAQLNAIQGLRSSDFAHDTSVESHTNFMELVSQVFKSGKKVVTTDEQLQASARLTAGLGSMPATAAPSRSRDTTANASSKTAAAAVAPMQKRRAHRATLDNAQFDPSRVIHRVDTVLVDTADQQAHLNLLCVFCCNTCIRLRASACFHLL
jgi:hypothetical protein